MSNDFKDSRRRSSDLVGGQLKDFVMGRIISTENPRQEVGYETARQQFDGETRATVNWSAMGAVPVPLAREYAAQILAACDAAEGEPQEFEPHDEVKLDGLTPLERAFVDWVGDDGAITLKITHPNRENVKTRTVLNRGAAEGLKRVDA